MTNCNVGQRLKQRRGTRIIEAVASYDDGREHGWMFIDTRRVCRTASARRHVDRLASGLAHGKSGGG